jgi:hypothetical protein
MQMQKAQAELEASQLQLETSRLANEKMKAEIAKLYADKDKVDANTYETMNRIELNTQKVVNDTVKAEAQANKTQEEIDAMQNKFVQHTTGAVRAREVEDQQFAADVDMAKQSSNKGQ